MHTLRFLLASVLLGLLGCASAPQLFEPIPEGLDMRAVPRVTVDMTAERFSFTPETVTVTAGTLVTLKVTATDATHGIALAAFGIDETIEEGQTVSIELYASEPGEYSFDCSHFCGLGHMGMNGKLVVE